jgi:hypothetical protein
MFLRFRQSKTTLIVQLVEAQRVNGTVRQRHRASLGSMSTEAPATDWDQGWTRAWPWQIVKDRTEIWQALHAAISDLAIDGATATKLMTALQARVPYVTEEDRGLAELLEAEHDNAFWDRMNGGTKKLIDCHKDAIAMHERHIVELEETSAMEVGNAETAKQKAARLANYRGG